MKTRNKNKGSRVRRMTLMAVFAALAYAVSLVIHFPVGFLTLDLKDAVIAVGAMALGPWAALIMTALSALLEFLTIADTGVYGLIMDILSSLAFALPAALIYRRHKVLPSAIVSLSVSILCMTAVMMAANVVITPLFMKVPTKEVVALLPSLFLPFNFVKALLNAGVVILLYKPLNLSLGRLLGTKHSSTERLDAKRTVFMSVTAVAIIGICLFILFLTMGATVDFGAEFR